MRLEEAIDVLRTFADERYPNVTGDEIGWAELRASRIVWEFDHLPTNPEPSAAQPVLVTVGIKDGHVVLNSHGTAEVEPSFLVWTASQAREVAAKLLELARSLDGTS